VVAIVSFLRVNYFFFVGCVLKGCTAALPTPKTNFANGSFVPDFLAGAFGFALVGPLVVFFDADFVVEAVAGRYLGALLAPYAFGFAAAFTFAAVALATREAP
jgi:hypothetical protein